MVRGHGKLRQLLCGQKLPSSWKIARSYATSYYILLPEVPPDTPETNALLRYKQFPEFSKITTGDIVRGAAKLCIEFDIKLGKHIQQLEDVHYPKTFETVFKPLEEILVPLTYLANTAENLGHQKDYRFKVAYQRAIRQITDSRDEIYVRESLYRAIKEVAADKENLDEYQKTLVDIYLKRYFDSFMDKPEAKREEMKTFYAHYIKDRDSFRDNVFLCCGHFKHKIEDPQVIQRLPRSLLSLISGNYEDGPWEVTVHEPIYTEFMSHCHDRLTRWNLWHAKVNVASNLYAEQHINNNVLIEDIRLRRKILGKNYGFANYAEFSLSNQMAKTVENVVTVLDELKTAVMPDAELELEDLRKFAQQTENVNDLKPWDWQYFKTQRALRLARLDSEGVSEYFQLPVVMEGLFNLCTKLFGVTFRENNELETWDEDVWVFDVLEEDGTYISTFYFDPYVRHGKLYCTTMFPGGASSMYAQTKPFGYLTSVLLPPKNPTEPALLSLREVHDLFGAFGTLLQQILNRSPYSETTGLESMEIDARAICSKFMKLWLQFPEVLVDISNHRITQKPLSTDLASKIIRGNNLLSCVNLMDDICQSMFDLEIHIVDRRKNSWYQVIERVHKNYMPCPLEEADKSPNSYLEVFGNYYGGITYATVWSQMLAVDIFEAFLEQGIQNDEKVAAVGKKFKETFLHYGGCIPTADLFRKFRDRDPSVGPIKKLYTGNGGQTEEH